jgi:hypothetical protein
VGSSAARSTPSQRRPLRPTLATPREVTSSLRWALAGAAAHSWSIVARGSRPSAGGLPAAGSPVRLIPAGPNHADEFPSTRNRLERTEAGPLVAPAGRLGELPEAHVSKVIFWVIFWGIAVSIVVASVVDHYGYKRWLSRHDAIQHEYDSLRGQRREAGGRVPGDRERQLQDYLRRVDILARKRQRDPRPRSKTRNWWRDAPRPPDPPS